MKDKIGGKYMGIILRTCGDGITVTDLVRGPTCMCQDLRAEIPVWGFHPANHARNSPRFTTRQR